MASANTAESDHATVRLKEEVELNMKWQIRLEKHKLKKNGGTSPPRTVVRKAAQGKVFPKY